MSLCAPQGMKLFYLGRPGNMQPLVVPDRSFTANLGRGEVAHALPSGGTTTTRRKSVKRSYVLNMSAMTPDTANVLLGFYAGAFGTGPFSLVDPSYRNGMSTDVSLFGMAQGAFAGWALPPGDALPTLDTGMPPFAVPGGVIRWAGPVNGHTLFEGTQAVSGLFVPAASSCPYLPSQDTTLSIYARTGSGTATVSWEAIGSTGSVARTATATLTTAWQRLTVNVPSGTAGWTAAAVQYINGALKCTQAASPDILLCCPQTDYGTLVANPWVLGIGVPRVTFNAGLGGASDVFWRRNHVVTLAEI